MGKPRAKTKVYHQTPNNITDRRKGSMNTWGTPRWFYNWLNIRFKFDLDACANSKNHKHENYYSLERGENSLDLPWGKRTFCNPPYGTRIPVFLAKGLHEVAKFEKDAVFLITGKIDTTWWHKYCWAATEIIELEGRLKFEGAKYGAPFPSAVVIFEHGKINLKEGPKRSRAKIREIKALMEKREKLVYLRPFTEEEAV